MTIGPEPMRRIFLRSVFLGMKKNACWLLAEQLFDGNECLIAEAVGRKRNIFAILRRAI
jgi:hypothetical protein